MAELSTRIVGARIRGDKSSHPGIPARTLHGQLIAHPAGLVFLFDDDRYRAFVIPWSCMEDLGWFADMGVFLGDLVIWIRYRDVDTNIPDTLQFAVDLPQFRLWWSMEKYAVGILKQIQNEGIQIRQSAMNAVAIRHAREAE